MYTDSSYRVSYKLGVDLVVNGSYKLDNGSLVWNFSVKNNSDAPLTIGDLSIPFLMNTRFKSPTETVFRHHLISGSNSWMFWMRPNSVGPYLTMTPLKGTWLEYFTNSDFRARGDKSFCAYIHSAADGAIAKEKGCNWRQPNTSLMLKPGESKEYGLKFQWAKDYEDVRRILVAEGLIDVEVVPGMTVPSDLTAKFALKTNQKIESVKAEFPEKTEIEHLGAKDSKTHLYQVKFHKLGENLITIKYGGGQTTYLEFFSTEPTETLIKKRAAFLAKSQLKDDSKWYNGLICETNNVTHVQLTPDNYDLIPQSRVYEVTCDDPALGKPAFLASKNVEYPNQAEVEALDYYIKHFVWGGLQQTTEEKYPYGVYGIPDWKTLRDSVDEGPLGKTHIWRIYDYPHVTLLYWSMYRVAKYHPEIRTELTKEQYLERAYGTATALFNYPEKLRNWSPYRNGLYNELVIKDIVDELYAVGWKEKADTLNGYWEKKVSTFVNEGTDLFESEYAFDSTGFESTHAFAKYAMDHPDVAVPDKAEAFMQQQMRANLFCRGWLENAYYLLGSDYRGAGGVSYTLTYMAQMGGWSVLDYALYTAKDPFKYLRLGYASYLSSWALMNSGTPESNYGYWFPGKESDGAAGGGFEPAPYGNTWLGQPHHRGSWVYSSEIDLGFTGALRCAATVLADDPMFGMFCYGGDWKTDGNWYQVVPKDGVNRRFHYVDKSNRLHMLLDTGQLASVQLKKDLSAIKLTVTSPKSDEHNVNLSISGIADGKYVVTSETETKEFAVLTGKLELNLKVKQSSDYTITRLAN